MSSPSGTRQRTRRQSSGVASDSPAGASGTRLVQRPKRRRTLRVGELLASAFLPSGFPDTVSPDYANFQLWDSVQGLCSYVRGTLSTAALLTAAGLGGEGSNAAAVSATLNFVARDMVGHLCGLAFSFAKGHQLDAAAKQWRFAADCLNNLGLLLHMLAPALPRALFVPTICVASVAHAITGVAGGATRTALTAHFAINGNAGELASKESAQETGVTLIGMALGYLFMSLTAASMRAQWFVFLFLTGLHVAANYKAMRALHLKSLNSERFTMLAAHFCRTGNVLTPAEIAARESLLPLRPPSFLSKLLHHNVPRVRLGVPLSALGATRPGITRRRGCPWLFSDKGDASLVALSGDSFPEPLTSTQAASFIVEAVASRSVRGTAAGRHQTGGSADVLEDLCVKLIETGWGNPLVFILDDLDEGHRFDED